MKWRIPILFLVMVLVAVIMGFVLRSPEPGAEAAGAELRPSARPDGTERGDAVSRKQRDAETRDEATRLLKSLQHAEGYEVELLQARLAAIFREWGRVDIEAAEDFLTHSHAAGGDP